MKVQTPRVSEKILMRLHYIHRENGGTPFGDAGGPLRINPPQKKHQKYHVGIGYWKQLGALHLKGVNSQHHPLCIWGMAIGLVYRAWACCDLKYLGSLGTDSTRGSWSWLVNLTPPLTYPEIAGLLIRAYSPLISLAVLKPLFQKGGGWPVMIIRKGASGTVWGNEKRRW